MTACFRVVSIVLALSACAGAAQGGHALNGGTPPAQAKRKEPGARAPIYFNVIHHQEAVGNPCTDTEGFPLWESFKENLRNELTLLDSRGIVSDQYFSDFLVSVVHYMELSGRDPQASQVFEWFKNSGQHLGYHFHPTTWDVYIRADEIADLPFEDAVAQYETWEEAYYDWESCLPQVYGDPCLNCGELDTGRTGGVTLMEDYFGVFGKSTVMECGLMWYAPVGRAFRDKYILPRAQQICCSQGAPHSHYRDDDTLRTMWTSDLAISSSELFIYTYKMMDLYFVKHTSNAYIEGRQSPVSLLAQKLDMLPRDVPHFFVIHLTVNTEPSDPLVALLDYLQGEFVPANLNSRFISGSELPSLVIENPRQFTVEELEEAAAYYLQYYMGRPPSFIKYGEHYMSNASLFKAVQFALQDYLGGSTWPQLRIPAIAPCCSEGRRRMIPKDSVLLFRRNAPACSGRIGA